MENHRERLLHLFSVSAQDRTAIAARRTHSRLEIPEPKIGEIAEYRKKTDGNHKRIRDLVFERCMESLLALRTKPLQRGTLPKTR